MVSLAWWRAGLQTARGADIKLITNYTSFSTEGRLGYLRKVGAWEGGGGGGGGDVEQRVEQRGRRERETNERD